MKNRVDVRVILGVLLLLGGLVALGMGLWLFRSFAVHGNGVGLVGGIVWGIGAIAVLVLGWTLVRPAPAGDEEAERRLGRRQTWAGLVIAMSFLPAAFLYVVPSHTHGEASDRKTQCLHHQRQIATILAERSLRRGWPKHGGKAFVLSLVADGVISAAEPKNLEVFFCPACGIPEFEPEMLWAYGRLTPESLDRTYLNSLTAYAGRRNDEEAYRLEPEDASSSEEPVLACLCHPRVALVAFADGSARQLDRERLGLAPDDPIIVGEDSKSPILKKLSFD